LGAGAGFFLITGSQNVDIANLGVAGESSTIRIGTSGKQTRTFISGIYGVREGGGAVSAVYINGNGQLGTQGPASSRRYALGQQALFHATTGHYNEAFGWKALYTVTTGSDNTAMGDGAAFNIDAGSFNTCVGNDTCGNVTSSSGNVVIGSGVAGDNTGNHTYIRNINTTAQAASAGTVDYVTVNLSTGLLGHGVSSRRYKEDIKPMDKASEVLYHLNPVTYRYKKEIDATQNLDYGLIAEEVAKVDPNLAVRNGKGQFENVRYTAINAMLLNEFLKEHKTVQTLQSRVEKQEAIIAQQQKGMEVLTAQLKEQTAQIQKVTAQVEMSKPSPTVVANTP
jgi:trimeric autotransporter adhesin